MRDYVCELHFSSDPAAVYKALTSPEGLAGWWTADCDVTRKVGEQSTFRFGATRNVIKITQLVPDREVRWECVDQFLPPGDKFAKSDEWVGTRPVFILNGRNGGGTELYFMHKGLHPGLACYQACAVGWDHYLKVSLKQYLEKGSGQPYKQRTEAAEAQA